MTAAREYLQHRPTSVAPVAVQKGALKAETTEDRLGAQRAWQAQSGTDDTDAMTQIATIVHRLLGRVPEAIAPNSTGTPSPEPLVGPDVAGAASFGAPQVPVGLDMVPDEKPDSARALAAAHGATSLPAAPATDGVTDAGLADMEKADREQTAARSVPQASSASAMPQKGPAEPVAQGISVVVSQAEPDQPEEGATPRSIVQRWQQGVRTAGKALPGVKVTINTEARADLHNYAGTAGRRNEATRKDLSKEVLATAKPAPVPAEPPPAPPPSNPVPELTQRILDKSGLKLPDQTPPTLAKSEVLVVENVPVGGTTPQIGDTPVASDVFQILITPQAEALLTPAPGTEESPEQKKLRETRAKLTAAPEVADRQGRGPQTIAPDTGPKPMPALPESLQAPVGKVVARLLAEVDATTAGVLDSLRDFAYPGGALKKNFPESGKDMTDGLKTAVTTDLREIALAANIAAADLDTMIKARKDELSASAKTSADIANAEGKAATDKTATDSQKTLDAIDGAAKVADEDTLRRQEAAGGATDPAEVNRRRDLTVSWIREHVTTQITAYQQSGDERTQSFKKVQAEQLGAYGALVQREQYQVMTPVPPTRSARDLKDLPREARLADFAVTIRAWGDDQAKKVTEAIRLMTKSVTDTTQTHRTDIQSVGSLGIEATRQWAEDRILSGQSWWTRFMSRIRRWISESHDASEQWRVRRTQVQRDTLALDMQAIAMAQARIAAGMNNDQILADETLSKAHRAVIAQYFAAGKDSDPLAFAGARLRTTMALDHLDHAREVFEAELSATPVSYKDFTTCEKLAEVARSTGGAFDPSGIAQKLRGAMDQVGTDEDQIFDSLRGLTPFRGQIVRKYFRAIYDRDLDDDIDDEMSGDEKRQAMAELEGHQSKADAIAIHDAMGTFSTNEAQIMKTLRNKSPEEAEAIRAEFLTLYGKTLDDALKADLDAGNEIEEANALLAGETAKADAIALDEAMRGGITALGTDEAEINRVLAQVRQEVLDRAKSEHWTSAQFQAEVRRRLGAISTAFGEKYADVAQYNEPGLAGDTLLEKALSSELSGSELDLSKALLKNDMVAADAAKINVEWNSLYVSDNKVLGVLRGQYERALELRQLDEGPARNMKVRAEVDRLRDQKDPKLTEDEISRRRIALERQMEKELAMGAKADAATSMDAVKALYNDRYHMDVGLVVAFGMDGKDQNQAFALLQNGGYLTPLQEVHVATSGLGTDTDGLKRTLKMLNKSEMQTLREEWAATHDGENFDEMLRGELSGREESDIMDMVAHGAPESDAERIEQEQRRVWREMHELTGVLGGAAAGPEAAWMEHSVGKLDALKTQLQDRNLDRPAREALEEKVSTQIQQVQDAVEDHRRRIDSFTDTATQIVGIVVGIAVAVVLGAISGGTLGVATIALLASLYATVATMATKLLIKGGAYGEEEYLTDVAVGAVDALTAVATAGMGSKLLKPLQAVVAKTRIKDVASFVAKSGLAKRLTTAAEGSFVARAANKLLPTPASLERGVAKFMAESAENAVGAVPSTFVGMALDDNTWKGDPLHTFLSGGGMSILQSVAMGHALAAGMHVAGGVFSHVRGEFRMTSDVGRLLEANRLITEGFGKFHEENPGGSISDFLAHSDGKKLRATIEARGLLPSVESLGRALESGSALRPDDVTAPQPPPKPEARAAELHGTLPEKLRDGSSVTLDPDLTGRSVRVEPLRIGKEIVGVDIRVGPDATPLDIALHGATVNAMLKYRGVLGNVRRALEDFAADLTGSGLTVGSRGWEARLELAKLPAILAARMDELSGLSLHPQAEARVLADISGLQEQFRGHQAVMANPTLRDEPGRGFVAAEEASARLRPDETPLADPRLVAEIRALAFEAGTAGGPHLDKLQARLAELPPGQRAAVVEALAAKPPRELGPNAKTGPTMDRLMGELDRVVRDYFTIRSATSANPRASGAHIRFLVELQKLRMLTVEGLASGDMSVAIAMRTEMVQRLPKDFARIVPELTGPRTQIEFLFDKAQKRAQGELVQAVRNAPDTDLAATEAVLKRLAETLNLAGSDLRGKVFNDMVDWIIQRGQDDMRRRAQLDWLQKDMKGKSLAELREAIASASDPEVHSLLNKEPMKTILDQPGPSDAERAVQLFDALEQSIAKSIGPQEGDYRGRRPEVRNIRDLLRGDARSANGIDLEGLMLASIVDENAAAVAELRDHLAKVSPDFVFGVTRGGPLLAEFLAPPGNPPPGNFVTVPKGKDNNRTVHLEGIVRKEIQAGKRTFAIVDVYMGGHAAGEFTAMFERLIKEFPEAQGLRFETLWLREKFGYERNVVENGELANGGLQPEYHVPEHLSGIVNQKIVSVRFVLGDDMHIVFDANSIRPIMIFDSDGRIVQVIEVGVRHPATGTVLSNPREILVALMQGYKFPR